jgi:hypothetical protein
LFGNIDFLDKYNYDKISPGKKFKGITMAPPLTPEQMQAAEQQAQAIRDFTNSLRYGTRAGEDYTKNSKYQAEQFKQAGSDFVSSMLSGAQGASVFNNTISTGSKVIGSFVSDIPFVGSALAKMGESAADYVIAVNKQSDVLFKSFQDLSTVGGSSAAGMQGMFDGMQQMGYTLQDLDKYKSVISENSTLMASFGGTVAEGAKKFAKVASGIQETGLQTEFLRMGLTVDDINKGQAGYFKILQQTGQLQGKTTGELTQGTAEYLRKQSELSRLTGLSVDQLAKKFEEDQKNERYQATMTELKMKAAAGDKSAADKLAYYTELVQKAANMPEEVREGIRDTISGFGQQTEAGQKFARMSAGAADMIAKGSGDVSTVLSTLVTDAKTQRESTAGYVKAVGDQTTYFKQSTLLGIEAANQGAKSAKENTVAAAAAAEKERKDLAQGTNVDINNRVAMQQAQTATTMAMQNLVQLGVHPIGAAMRGLASGIEQTVTSIPGTGDMTSVKDKQQGAYTGLPGPNQLPGEFGMGGYVIDQQIVKNNEKTLKGIQSNMEGFESLLGDSLTRLSTALSVEKFREYFKGSLTETAASSTRAAQTAASTEPSGTRTSRAAQTAASAEPSDTRTPRAAQTAAAAVPESSTVAAVAATMNRFSENRSQAGPNDRSPTRLENTRPETSVAPAAAPAAEPGLTAEIGQGFASMAQSIGIQTQSMVDMVDLMRKSVDLQGRILQQARN